MCVWFIVLAVLGAVEIAGHPKILASVNPVYAVRFVLANPWLAFLALGAVVLAVTGTEALYADMGHFGAKPIRRAWFFFVGPALVLNYFGQGALLLDDPAAIKNPFYLLAPSWALVPLVILATSAAIIASQAVISGAFSLTRAAIQMGYAPRLKLMHTSAREIGQIYVPFINWTLLVAVILLVLGFRSSDNLGGAYGIAVTLAMLIDSVLIFFVMRRIWRWAPALAFGVVVPLAMIDFAFLASNSLKIPDGGWFPLAIGAVVFTLLTTWKKGRTVLLERLNEDTMPLDIFIESIATSPPTRVPGTAVFLTSTADRVPHALLHNLKHNKVLHERVVFLTIVTRDIPRVRPAERVAIDDLGCNFWQIRADFGFVEEPDVPGAARGLQPPRLRVRHDGHVVLRLARDADRHGDAGHGAVAREAVRLDVAERGQGDRLLPHPDQPRGRAGNAGRALTEAGKTALTRRFRGTLSRARERVGVRGQRCRVSRRRSARASTAAPCSRSGGCARRTRRTRRRGPAAWRRRPRAASAPR